MTELPTNVNALRLQVARAHLLRQFQQTFGATPPDYVVNDPQELRLAAREWRNHYAPQIALLAAVAQQALNYFEQQGFQAAITNFTSSVITQAQLNTFMRDNPYLEELVASTCKSSDQFRTLLNLFTQLGEERRR